MCPKGSRSSQLLRLLQRVLERSIQSSLHYPLAPTQSPRTREISGNTTERNNGEARENLQEWKFIGVISKWLVMWITISIYVSKKAKKTSWGQATNNEIADAGIELHKIKRWERNKALKYEWTWNRVAVGRADTGGTKLQRKGCTLIRFSQPRPTFPLFYFFLFLFSLRLLFPLFLTFLAHRIFTNMVLSFVCTQSIDSHLYFYFFINKI